MGYLFYHIHFVLSRKDTEIAVALCSIPEMTTIYIKCWSIFRALYGLFIVIVAMLYDRLASLSTEEFVDQALRR